MGKPSGGLECIPGLSRWAGLGWPAPANHGDANGHQRRYRETFKARHAAQIVAQQKRRNHLGNAKGYGLATPQHSGIYVWNG